MEREASLCRVVLTGCALPQGTINLLTRLALHELECAWDLTIIFRSLQIGQ